MFRFIKWWIIYVFKICMATIHTNCIRQFLFYTCILCFAKLNNLLKTKKINCELFLKIIQFTNGIKK